MTVKYIVDGESLAEPADPQEPLHKYHEEVATLVDCDIHGLAGRKSKIRWVVLSEETDVSDVETWLDASLSLINE